MTTSAEQTAAAEQPGVAGTGEADSRAGARLSTVRSAYPGTELGTAVSAPRTRQRPTNSEISQSRGTSRCGIRAR